MATRDKQARIRIREGMAKLTRFSIKDLQGECRVSRTVIQRSIHYALSRGDLELVEMQENGKAGNIYELVQYPRPMHTPSAATRNARDRAWTSMRILGEFNLPKLQTSAEINKLNAKKYVYRLQQAGYLQVVEYRKNGTRDSNIYHLVRNSGPISPIIKRDGTVFDPNTNTLYTKKLNET